MAARGNFRPPTASLSRSRPQDLCARVARARQVTWPLGEQDEPWTQMMPHDLHECRRCCSICSLSANRTNKTRAEQCKRNQNNDGHKHGQQQQQQQWLMTFITIARLLRHHASVVAGRCGDRVGVATSLAIDGRAINYRGPILSYPRPASSSRAEPRGASSCQPQRRDFRCPLGRRAQLPAH